MIFPIADNVRKEYKGIMAGGDLLLMGLTGGIASGKSTVARFLHELGSVIIDFDILARQVVSPGAQAWVEIVEYFGEEILLDNRELDRKKISEIVFLDAEKRKKIEAFTHPAIGEAFVREVARIASGENSGIIQAVIPLLVECNMQDLFHSIILVHIPREKQICRLMERDGITRDMALNIINAQMPIDEKIGSADFIVNNGGTLEETMIQVKELWDSLLEMKRGLKKAGASQGW